MKRKLIPFIAFILIIIGCSPMLYIPKCPDSVIQEKLTEGRKLYVKHCNGCHNLYLPDQFSKSLWKTNVDEMQPKAKISDNEKKLILDYLLYNR